MSHFTWEEAQALLPKVSALMGEAQGLKGRLDAGMARWRSTPPVNPVDGAIARGQLEFLVKEINQRLDGICRLGALPKDVQLGLVDFPTEMANEGEAYYCWRVGETHISHWHRTTEGFSARKAIPLPAPW